MGLGRHRRLRLVNPDGQDGANPAGHYRCNNSRNKQEHPRHRECEPNLQQTRPEGENLDYCQEDDRSTQRSEGTLVAHFFAVVHGRIPS